MLFTDIGAQLGADAEDSEKRVLDDLVRIAVERVDGADYAGITVGRDQECFQTPAATSELVMKCDQIQYELASGPCVDAALEQSVFNAADLRTDPRWPEFGHRCVEHTGIVSMLSIRLFVESDAGMIAGLNMYSHQPDAFDDNSEAVGQLLATHGALAVAKASAQDKSRNLLRALETSREIGMAMGIIMNACKVTRDQAFDLLRTASQHSHRRLADVASLVAETGAVPNSLGEQQR